MEERLIIAWMEYFSELVFSSIATLVWPGGSAVSNRIVLWLVSLPSVGVVCVM